MGRNSEAEGDSPSSELPPDRIHYLLPEGCSNITDKWEMEATKKLEARRERRSDKLESAKASALQLFQEAKSILPPLSLLKNNALPLSGQVILPETVTVATLSQLLNRKVFEVIKAAIGLELFLKSESVLTFEVAAAICRLLGVEARQAGSSDSAQGA